MYKLKYVVEKGLYWLIGYLAFLYLLPSSVATQIIANLLLAVTVVSMAYTKPHLSHNVLKGNDISYGVYIYHGLLINIFIGIGLTNRVGYLLLLSCITYMIGYLSWIGIEKPFLRKKKKTINTEFAEYIKENETLLWLN